LDGLLKRRGLSLADFQMLSQGGTTVIRFVVEKEEYAFSPLIIPASTAKAPDSKEARQKKTPPSGYQGSKVTLEDLSRFSRELSKILDDLFPEEEGPDYLLEVSSPGLDRPLKTLEDFRRFSGALVKLTLRQENRKLTVKGRLGTRGEGFTLAPLLDPAKKPKRSGRDSKKKNPKGAAPKIDSGIDPKIDPSIDPESIPESAPAPEDPPLILFGFDEVVKARLIPEL
jgi:ribosome maturation factor RimP